MITNQKRKKPRNQPATRIKKPLKTGLSKHFWLETPVFIRLLLLGTSRNPRTAVEPLSVRFFYAARLRIATRRSFFLVLSLVSGLVARSLRVFRPIVHAIDARFPSMANQRRRLYTQARIIVCARARTLPIHRSVLPELCFQSPNTCSTLARIFARR